MLHYNYFCNQRMSWGKNWVGKERKNEKNREKKKKERVHWLIMNWRSPMTFNSFFLHNCFSFSSSSSSLSLWLRMVVMQQAYLSFSPSERERERERGREWGRNREDWKARITLNLSCQLYQWGFKGEEKVLVFQLQGKKEREERGREKEWERREGEKRGFKI